MRTSKRPIGIFDSGIGGLTVAKEIVKTLPHESIIYIGDTARVPYGTRSKRIVTEFALELVDFLLKCNVKCLVVACNTISALSLAAIKNVSSVPLVDVLNPVVKKAEALTKNKKIGVIGTQGTIKSRAYERAIKKINPKIRVYSSSCPLFVPLAEEGLHKHKATKFLAKEYLAKLIKAHVDTLILGCTHYPILYQAILETMGSKVSLVDSAGPAVEELKKVLEENGLLSQERIPRYEFFVTDAPERVFQVASTFFGDVMEDKIKKVSLTD